MPCSSLISHDNEGDNNNDNENSNQNKNDIHRCSSVD